MQSPYSMMVCTLLNLNDQDLFQYHSFKPFKTRNPTTNSFCLYELQMPPHSVTATQINLASYGIPHFCRHVM
eukprot:6261427-Amphidinium_carterae.1